MHRLQAVLALTIKPKTGSQQPIHTALSYPVTVTGCGLVPAVAVQAVALAATKEYSWQVDKTASPAAGLNLKFTQEDFVK